MTDEKNMETTIREYFEHISKDQLLIDLEKAEYSFYKNVESYTLEPVPASDCIFAYESLSKKRYITNKLKHHEEFVPENADNIDYKVAA